MSKTISDISTDEYVKASLEEMSVEGIPQAVEADTVALKRSALLLAEFVHEQVRMAQFSRVVCAVRAALGT